MNRQQAAAMSSEQVSAKKLAESTKKSYEGNIRTLIGHMTADQKIEYLREDGKLIKPLEASLARDLLHESQKISIEGIETLKSIHSCEGFKSAIKYWHTSSNRGRPQGVDLVTLTPEAEISLSDYSSARRRIDASDRAEGEEVVGEGKLPMSFKGYSMLANRAIHDVRSAKEALLIHPYLVLSWNLMARSSNIVGLLWNNIRWTEDCISVVYEKSKTNQKGTKKTERHIYANPKNPSICPILALGLKLVSETDFSQGPFKVFPATTSDNSFSSWLKKKVADLEGDDLESLDVPIDRIGTHSLRKGSATYVCGLTDCPSTDAVKLRIEFSRRV